MPTIPNVNLKETRISQRQQPIVQLAQDPISDVMQDFAGDLNKMAEVRTQNQTAKARNQFLILKSQQDNAYDDDEEFGTIGQRYDSSMNEGLSLAAQGIESSEAREMFVSDMSVGLEQGRQRMTDLVRIKAKDRELTDINSEMLILLQEGSRPDSDIGFINGAVQERLKAAADRNVIDHVTAGKMGQEFTNNLALDKLTTLSAEDRLEALKEDWVQNLPAVTLGAVKREAEEELRLGKAQTAAYQALTKGLDRNEATQSLYAEFKSDPELYRDAMTQFGVMYQNKRVNESEQAVDLFNNYADGVIDGSQSTAEIIKENPKDWYAMTPGAQQNLIRWEESKALGKSRTDSDRGVLFKLMSLQRQGANARPDLERFFMENSSLLNQSDFKAWSEIVIGKNEGLLTPQTMLANATRNMTDDRKISQIYTRVQDWYFAEQQKTGIVDEEQIQRKIKFEIQNLNVDWGFDDTPGEMDIEELAESYLDPENAERRDLIRSSITDTKEKAAFDLSVFEKGDPQGYEDYVNEVNNLGGVNFDTLNNIQKLHFLKMYKLATQ